MDAARGTDHFEALYRRDADPWQVHTRWYEQRKQALLLACLPHRRYGRGFETACGTGALTAALAQRCDALLACDASQTAIGLTRAHLARVAAPAQARVQVSHQALPGDWPAGRFDLIVVSEWANYLDGAALQALALVEALQRLCATIAWSAAPRVTTSARTDARARGGFGDALLDMRRVSMQASFEEPDHAA